MSVDGRGVPRWGKNSPKRSDGSGVAQRSAVRSRKTDPIFRGSADLATLAPYLGGTWEMSVYIQGCREGAQAHQVLNHGE